MHGVHTAETRPTQSNTDPLMAQTHPNQTCSPHAKDTGQMHCQPHCQAGVGWWTRLYLVQHTTRLSLNRALQEAVGKVAGHACLISIC
jgi:hypothetical protein